jgi:hypothetical protein
MLDASDPERYRHAMSTCTRCRSVMAALSLCAAAACGPSFMPRASGDLATASTAADPALASRSAAAAFANPGGMWMPSQMAQHAEQLRELGLVADPEAFTDPTAHPLGAVVWLGGCTGSFVSPEGLVITNHHCVTRALQENSTKERNLLEEGFVARTRAAEQWVGPTGRIFVTREIRDVTAAMRAGLEATPDPKARHDLIETRTKETLARCEKGRPGIRCRLASAFGGGQWWLMEQLELRDVRLVYAPPDGIGNFGGEKDNWRWPRHVGDVAMLRAYVDEHGAPADHSAANVPYRPARHLKLATEPLEAGDLVFVTGFPGSTRRWRTAAEVEEAVAWEYPRTIELCDETIALLEKLGRSDPDLAIKGARLLRGLNNWRTNTRGMLEGLEKGGLARRKVGLEAGLKAWVDADPGRKQRYGGAVERLAQAHGAYRARRDQDAALEDALWLSSLLGAAERIVRMAEERPKPDAERDPRFQERNAKLMADHERAAQRTYDRRLDLAKLALVLERAARLPEHRQPTLVRSILRQRPPTSANIRAALEKMYDQTALEDLDVRLRLLRQASTKELSRLDDPFVKLVLAIRPELQQREDQRDVYAGATAIDRPLYVAALRDKAGGRLAPDANSTLRITYGTVRGYRPQPEAEVYHPFTYLPEVVAKHTGEDPFVAPARLLEAAKRPAGRYAATDRSQVPVNFLADLDITGGNSGSPTLNARGELCGLVFDGNYESIASDWLFMPAVTRSIHVDLRYVLWLLAEVDGATHLLAELGASGDAR